MGNSVYIYDRKYFIVGIYGNYQLPFNMSFNLDESKDSCKINILSKNKDYLEPNTILRLEDFDDAWFVVTKDNVRLINNENGFLYEHDVSLSGGIEFLGKKELISCGFNVNRYTIDEFIKRLFSLSTFDFPITINYNNSLSKDDKVNFLKTFENYTLLSALKEFLNGYNCVPKLRFVENNGQIESAVLDIYSKSGNFISSEDLDYFDKTNDVSFVDEESFGDKVLSNVQNCVSSKVISYPDIGSCNLYSSVGEITYDNVENAKILLPTNAYYVDSIEFYTYLPIYVYIEEFGDRIEFILTPDDLSRNGLKCRDEIMSAFRLVGRTDLVEYVQNNWLAIFGRLKPCGVFTLKNGGYYDYIADEEVGESLIIHSKVDIEPNMYLYLNNERYSFVTNGEDRFVITWKQGSREISGFAFYPKAQRVLAGYPPTYFNKSATTFELGGITFLADENANKATMLDEDGIVKTPRTLYKVNYIPMNDLRVKTDNKNSGNDTLLYNQNGKLVDGYAVSKLIKGYSESISGGNLTKSKMLYDYEDIPLIATRFGDYIINNVSIDVYDNDNGFAFDCDFVLNKYSSCKSYMISANTSIRDYDCPQENNIKRIQNYRDILEFSYTKDQYASDTYLVVKEYLVLDYDHSSGFSFLGFDDRLCCVIKATDSDFHNVDDGSHNYYYKIQHTSYNLANKLMLVFDLNDNNIIGYDNRSTKKPFELINIFNAEKLVSVPISYVDNYGELDELELCVFSNESADYCFDGIFLSGTCIINGHIYDRCYDASSMIITEDNYKKDGLEIPVFAYSLEMNGDENIYVGSEILEFYKKKVYIAVIDNAIINEHNFNNFIEPIGLACDIDVDYTDRSITFTPLTTISDPKHKCVLIYTKDENNNNTLMFALNDYYSSQRPIKIYFNCYKSK